MNGFGVSPLELMASDAMLQGVVFLDEFTYSAPFVDGTPSALGSGGTVEVQIQINGDSDFIVQESNLIGYDKSNPPAIVADPNLLVTLVRAGSGREIMNNAQHVRNLFGNYSVNHVPGRNPMSGLINANNILTVRLQNLSTTNFSRVDVAFRGFKVFYITNSQGVTGNRQMVFHAM